MILTGLRHTLTYGALGLALFVPGIAAAQDQGTLAGAVLDPLAIIGDMERELGVPVIASNPAMLWSILSKLGRSYRIEGSGRLLAEWPAAG